MLLTTHSWYVSGHIRVYHLVPQFSASSSDCFTHTTYIFLDSDPFWQYNELVGTNDGLRHQWNRKTLDQNVGFLWSRHLRQVPFGLLVFTPNSLPVTTRLILFHWVTSHIEYSYSTERWAIASISIKRFSHSQLLLDL